MASVWAGLRVLYIFLWQFLWLFFDMGDMGDYRGLRGDSPYCCAVLPRNLC
jgi:hypothetical protein